MKLVHVNCFCTKSKESGNPAAVVLGFTNARNAKQQLAKELNLPVTVFVSSQEQHPKLEFFYPNAEMPLCIHGTLAAARVLHEINIFDDLTCLTNSCKLHITKTNDDVFQIVVTAQLVKKIVLQKEEICNALNLKADAIVTDLPFAVASVGSPKLLVPISSLELLANLNPDFAKIKAWSITNQVNGFYVYTREIHNAALDFHARGFNPITGHNEDAATGTAAGALALAIRKSAKIEQGNFVRRPCVIDTAYQDTNHIFVGGKTIIRY